MEVLFAGVLKVFSTNEEQFVQIYNTNAIHFNFTMSAELFVCDPEAV